MKSSSVTIQMKAIEQYLPVLSFESVDEILKCDQLNERYWEVLSYGSLT